ncbi:hypothetical protein ACFL41_01255 [Gemmatimonadota bacterium]
MRFRVLFLSLGILSIGINSTSITAQQAPRKRVFILPLATSGDFTELVTAINHELSSSISFSQTINQVDPGEIPTELTESDVRSMLQSPRQMTEFCDRFSLQYLVGGTLTETMEGELELIVVIFSEDEQNITAIIHRKYSNVDDLYADLGQVTRELSRSRYYSAFDIPFFASILLPGSGQIMMRKPLHGIISAGLVVGAAVYGLSTPRADQFVVPGGDYETYWNQGLGEYQFLYRNQAVTKEEYYQNLSADLVHMRKARGERRAEEVRKKRALGLLISAYLINLVDTLALNKQPLDTSSFFLSLESMPPVFNHTRPGCIRLQLNIIIR